jgi:hypothetical protein
MEPGVDPLVSEEQDRVDLWTVAPALGHQTARSAFEFAGLT